MASERDRKYAAKSMATLKKLFNYLPDKNENNIIPVEKQKGYLDKSNVLMIIPKTYFLKTLLTQDFDVTETNIPELKYKDNSGGVYQINFLNMIIPLLKNTSSKSFKISTSSEYPMILEVAEVKIIIAPYMNEDWK